MNGRKRQSTYRQRQRERGLVEVVLWIPERDKSELQRIAADRREQFEKEQTPAGDGGLKDEE